jgi:hypothetical protein
MKFKMKKNEVWNEKKDVWNEKMKFGETKNENTIKNKWKINENKKMIEKQKEKNMKLQMKTQMKNNWKK